MTIRPNLTLSSYLQIIPVDNELDRTMRVAEATRLTKELAIRTKCPVSVGVQARRETDNSKSPIPSMADAQWSSAIEQIADKLFGEDYYWSVLAGGRHQLPFVTMSAIMGGNVRVGLEDSLYAGKGRLATSNAEQVTIIRSIIENLSLEIASPTEAREMLHLKGGDQVSF